MHNDLDSLLARLAGQPAPLRLNGLEASVRRSLHDERRMPDRTWRYAAVGLALFVGVGIGSSAASLRQSMAPTDLTDAIRFAPSSLLEAST